MVVFLYGGGVDDRVIDTEEGTVYKNFPVENS